MSDRRIKAGAHRPNHSAYKAMDEVTEGSAEEQAKREVLLAQVPRPSLKDQAPVDSDLAQVTVDPWTGLTSRQQYIQTAKLQGLSMTAIAKSLSVSLPIVYKELNKIREVHKQNGATLDPDAYVGEAMGVYQNVLHESYLILAKAKNSGNIPAQIQALQLAMSAQQARTKMLLDIGLVQKKANEVKVTVEGNVGHDHEHSHTHVAVNPILESMSDAERATFGRKLLESQLSDLQEPEPPQDEPDYIEGEIIEDVTE